MSGRLYDKNNNDLSIEYKINNKENINKINSLRAKKCFTSPDLLGRENQIPAYAKLIKDFNLKIDAICCKNENISLWESILYN